MRDFAHFAWATAVTVWVFTLAIAAYNIATVFVWPPPVASFERRAGPGNAHFECPGAGPVDLDCDDQLCRWTWHGQSFADGGR